MKYYPEGGYFACDAANWLNFSGKKHLRIAITGAALKRRMTRGLRWQLGQLYGIVACDAINAKFAYQGLNRRMYVADNPGADGDKYALIWTPGNDFYLAGDKFSPVLEPHTAPEQQVFVTYVSPNHTLDTHPEVDGWIEHWTWVDEDLNHNGRPIDFGTRYDRCIWSKG